MALNRSKFLRWLAAPRLLFYVLPWLMLLLTLGTLVQRDIGLYDAERLYFASWWVWLGPLPLPGVYPTLALMTLSLLAKLILKSVWHPRFVGTLLTHGGALVLLAGGLVTSLTAEEGYIPLRENTSANRITDYHDRRLAIYKSYTQDYEKQETRSADRVSHEPATRSEEESGEANRRATVSAEGEQGAIKETTELLSIPHHALSQGDVISDDQLPFTLTLTDYFRHAVAKPREDEDANYQGIAQQVRLEAGELMKEDEANHTGLVFDISLKEKPTPKRNGAKSADEASHEPAARRLTARAEGAQEAVKEAEGRYLLFEPMPRYPTFEIAGATYEIRLGKVQRPLPFSLTLNDFDKISYPGTMQAREYQSDITLKDGEVQWRGLIAMNEPLRYGGYTFYQSSFVETPQGPISVLAVVKNDGLLFPYIASALMTFGMLWHIAIHLKSRRRKDA